MSDALERAHQYRATAEVLEKRAQKSSGVKDEFLSIARQYRRLADDLETKFTFSQPLGAQFARRD